MALPWICGHDDQGLCNSDLSSRRGSNGLPRSGKSESIPWQAGPVTSLAITVLGQDRPGIIAQTAGVLAEAGMNLEDSSMTLLRGHFAMTLVCRGETPVSEIERALSPLVDGALIISVRELPDEPVGESSGEPWLMTVHGADRLGIVARLVGVVADAGGNITDLTTRLSGELYVLLAEVDLPVTTSVESLQSRLAQAAGLLGVDASLRPLDRDDL